MPVLPPRLFARSRRHAPALPPRESRSETPRGSRPVRSPGIRRPDGLWATLRQGPPATVRDGPLPTLPIGPPQTRRDGPETHRRRFARRRIRPDRLGRPGRTLRLRPRRPDRRQVRRPQPYPSGYRVRAHLRPVPPRPVVPWRPTPLLPLHRLLLRRRLPVRPGDPATPRDRDSSRRPLGPMRRRDARPPAPVNVRRPVSVLQATAMPDRPSPDPPNEPHRPMGRASRRPMAAVPPRRSPLPQQTRSVRPAPGLARPPLRLVPLWGLPGIAVANSRKPMSLVPGSSRRVHGVVVTGRFPAHPPRTVRSEKRRAPRLR